MRAPDPWTPPQPGRSTVGTLVYLLLGPVIWAAHFMAIYAAQGALCETGASPAFITLTVYGLTAPAIIALVLALVLPGPAARLLRAHGWGEETAGFLNVAMRLMAMLSVFGVVFAGVMAPLILPACPALR